MEDIFGWITTYSELEDTISLKRKSIESILLEDIGYTSFIVDENDEEYNEDSMYRSLRQDEIEFLTGLLVYSEEVTFKNKRLVFRAEEDRDYFDDILGIIANLRVMEG